MTAFGSRERASFRFREDKAIDREFDCFSPPIRETVSTYSLERSEVSRSHNNACELLLLGLLAGEENKVEDTLSQTLSRKDD